MHRHTNAHIRMCVHYITLYAITSCKLSRKQFAQGFCEITPSKSVRKQLAQAIRASNLLGGLGWANARLAQSARTEIGRMFTILCKFPRVYMRTHTSVAVYTLLCQRACVRVCVCACVLVNSHKAHD